MNDKNLLGLKLRLLRKERKLTQQDLAKLADVSVNSISMVERGGISPSVATLQSLAAAFKVRVSYFFEDDLPVKVIHLPADKLPFIQNGGMTISGLGQKLVGQYLDPFFIRLAPHTEGNSHAVVHLGHEFVYCLRGMVDYTIDGSVYKLNHGDMLLFEATLPHMWQNSGEEEAELLLVLQAEATHLHFADNPSVVHLG